MADDAKKNAVVRQMEAFCRDMDNRGSDSDSLFDNSLPIPEMLYFYGRSSDTYTLWNRQNSHDYYIFVYVVSGSRIVKVNDAAFVVNGGEAILLPPFARHEFSGKNLKFIAFMAKFKIKTNSALVLNSCGTVTKLPSMLKSQLLKVVGVHQEYLDGKKSAAGETIGLFALFLHNFCYKASRGEPLQEESLHSRTLLCRISDYLAQHREQHVTLAELSRALYVSGSTIRQVFRKEMKISLGHYQLVQRLKHGCHLLVDTDLSVDEIARRVGFKSTAGFRNAIKRECHGSTPLEIRHKKRNSKE